MTVHQFISKYNKQCDAIRFGYPICLAEGDSEQHLKLTADNGGYCFIAEQQGNEIQNITLIADTTNQCGQALLAAALLLDILAGTSLGQRNQLLKKLGLYDGKWIKGKKQFFQNNGKDYTAKVIMANYGFQFQLLSKVVSPEGIPLPEKTKGNTLGTGEGCALSSVG